MGQLTTDVLDTAHRCPADGIRIELRAAQGVLLRRAGTNLDGRADAPLLGDADCVAGTYKMSFLVADYLRRKWLAAVMPFLDVGPIRFSISSTQLHCQVPLVVSPWSYSTYRGS